MKIITPHNKISQKVVSLGQDDGRVAQEVKDLEKLVDRKDFPGRWGSALALSHCQVSDQPYKFFCIAKELEEAFGHKTIFNLRIVDKAERIKYKEGCMSYPQRDLKNTYRYSVVVVEFEYKGFLGTLKTERRALSGIAAIVAQHEYDHSNGEDIYHKFPK